MTDLPADVTGILPDLPAWLARRLEAAGGGVPFRTYMDWALHDPDHGYYGSGRARIGPRGDFATSPSLGEEFAGLLLCQIIEWLERLPGERLSLLEAGPGEGQLARQLARGLADARPDLAARTEVVLLEPNPGMAARQKRALASSPLPLRWCGWDELRRQPARGVVIAHEVLDALPVDRVEWDGSDWRWQVVAMAEGTLALRPGPRLAAEERAMLEGLLPERGPLPPGWCTELHPGLEPWLRACAEGLREGVLLVVDYALEAQRYYSPLRANGTLMAYRSQRACADPLRSPGQWDITAHLCLDTTRRAASAAGWRWLGERRQGEALLALGLARRLAGLRHLGKDRLAEGLRRREQLLRLVDPRATGDFRWLVLERSKPGAPGPGAASRCLAEPPSLPEEPLPD